MDLFEHEVAEAALLGLAHVPVDVDDLGRDRSSVKRRDLRSHRSHRHDLTLAEDQHLLGVRDHGRDVRGEEELVLAHAEHQRRVHSRADQKVRLVSRHDPQRVRTRDSLQGAAHGGQKIFTRRVLDQVGDDLAVSLGHEDVTAGHELVAELSEVFDDAVVDDDDPAAAVGVGMCVDKAWLAVSRPACVADAEAPLGHAVLQPGREQRDLARALGGARQP